MIAFTLRAACSAGIVCTDCPFVLLCKLVDFALFSEYLLVLLLS